MNLKYWIRRPHLIPARIIYWVWEKRNPDKPWMSPGSVDYLEKTLTKNMTALEFGSGRSTIWFARYVGKITSVEHNSDWFDQVQTMIAKGGIQNIDNRLVALDHPYEEGEHKTYNPLPTYVRVLESFPDESLDFVVVDGHYRTNCARESLRKIRPGGLLLIDDVNEWGTPAGTPVPKDWPLVNFSGNGIKTTGIWRKPESKQGIA